MPQSDIDALYVVARFVAILGGVGIVYGGFIGLRRLVHVLDDVQAAAWRLDEASQLIIREFRPNGGRMEHGITSEADAQRATVKDLMLDHRSILAVIRANGRKHDAEAERRADRLLAKLEELMAKLK